LPNLQQPGIACFAARAPLQLAALIACALLGLEPGVSRSQISSQQANQLRTALGTRVEALTILGGDFGLSDGSYRSTGPSVLSRNRPETDIDVTKLGGAGDIGDPSPLGNTGIGWQPRLQGNMGYLDLKNLFQSPPLQGDVSRFRDFAIEFGGGARFWVSEALSFAPTFMGLYGHTSNEYSGNSIFARTTLGEASQLGLVDWRVETWSIRPALDIQYVLRLERAIVTLSSAPTYFYTESFRTSNPAMKVSGDSGSLVDKIDLDIPLGMQLFGHELRSGGYLSRTELFGDLKTGLDVGHVNELHGRVVMDFLNQFWKVQWIGLGASYLWGTNITGWTFGADVAFRF
jgi:hypothetical protein